MSRSVGQVLSHASPVSPSWCASPPSGRPSRCLRPGRQVRRCGLESCPVLSLSRLRLRCSSSFSSSMSSYASASAFMRPRFPKRPLLLLLLQRRFFSVLFSVLLLRPMLRQCPVLPLQGRQKCSASKSTGCSPSTPIAPHIPLSGAPHAAFLRGWSPSREKDDYKPATRALENDRLHRRPIPSTIAYDGAHHRA